MLNLPLVGRSNLCYYKKLFPKIFLNSSLLPILSSNALCPSCCTFKRTSLFLCTLCLPFRWHFSPCKNTNKPYFSLFFGSDSLRKYDASLSVPVYRCHSSTLYLRTDSICYHLSVLCFSYSPAFPGFWDIVLTDHIQIAATCVAHSFS